MPRPDYLLIIATVLPLVSFTILVFVGKRMGKPLAGIVATAAIFLGFICSILAMISWVPSRERTYTPPGESVPIQYGMGEHPINIPVGWVPAGYAKPGDTTFLKVGVYVDSLTIVMFAMITLVDPRLFHRVHGR